MNGQSQVESARAELEEMKEASRQRGITEGIQWVRNIYLLGYTRGIKESGFTSGVETVNE